MIVKYHEVMRKMLHCDIYKKIALNADLATLKNLSESGPEFENFMNEDIFWQEKFDYDNLVLLPVADKSIKNWLIMYEKISQIKLEVIKIVDCLNSCKFSVNILHTDVITLTTLKQLTDIKFNDGKFATNFYESAKASSDHPSDIRIVLYSHSKFTGDDTEIYVARSRGSCISLDKSSESFKLCRNDLITFLICTSYMNIGYGVCNSRYHNGCGINHM